MRAKKCDVCGEFYEDDGKAQKYKLYGTSDTASNYSKRMDMCPICQGELTQWIEEKKHDNS